VFVVPQLLIAEGIPFKTIRQLPGEYVITFPGAFHTVVNGGTNVAEAINFATRDCTCTKGTSGVAKCTCSEKEGIEAVAESLKIYEKKP
jgi:jumonji domain-containing protein 2